MNLLYLGSLSTLHAQNFISVFYNAGYNVTIINTRDYPKIFPKHVQGLHESFYIYNLYENMKIALPLQRTRLIERILFLSLTNSHKFRASVGKILREKQIDVIFSYWGSDLFPEIKKIKRNFDIPIVHNFETYPVSCFPWGVKLENLYCRKAIESLSGRIHSTQIMLSYMKKRFNLSYGKDLVFMQWFSERYFPKKQLPKLSDEDGEPHIIFIGNTEFKNKLDDIRPQIRRIVRKKIHVHVHETNRPLENSRFIHMFKGFDALQLIDGSLATFMTQFDACIVLYNFPRNICMDRFHNSAPSRFIFALTAGIPMILPMGYFTGCEQIIDEQKMGFAYRNYEDLKNKIYDERLMAYYEKNAEKRNHSLAFENNFERFDRFLKSIVES